ncbi:hypothetical protein TELCIR_16111 [Teladorsagia circumcincta]|uniref:TRPM-like domain-containing protein n=1 Tax=Teladorsagia circumcincta TaxID=45464 RepID=A0A2G9TYP4_TELCI|nr:hypothetical protein TELCIR_16111 [Teladorsagia circumcincta]
MAMCLWQHGEEALAKALVACRLYKSLATEAAEDYLEVEICDELKKYAEEFRTLSLELLEHCYHQDDAQTLQLLTYELSNWGCQTCLSLAVMVNNKQFLAHPCSSSSEDSSGSSFEDEEDEEKVDADKDPKRSRRVSHGSVQSLNIASVRFVVYTHPLFMILHCF